MDAKEQTPRANTARKTPTAPDSTQGPAPATEANPAKTHRRLGLVLNDRYRIEALIASGGMSDVYKAVDLHLEAAGTRDCHVALKILRSELTQDANALNLLAREAAKSKRLSHPNIIRVHDLERDGDTWYIVMELLDGEPLSRMIQRAKPNGLAWKGGRAVLEQVASALAYSHQRGIVHADLKPSNIFFTRDGEIKLLDFGVAQALKPHQHTDFLNPRHDDETTIYGYTPAYATPSLIDGKDPTVKDDLYALACISYELLSSRHPFDRQKLSREERASLKLSRPRRMPGRLWGAVRTLLKNEGASLNMAQFQTAMEPRQWRHLLYPAGMAALAVLSVAIWQQGEQRVQAAEAALVDYQEHATHLAELGTLPTAELLGALDALTPLERAGFLKLHEEAVLRHYAQRVEADLEPSGSSALPNIPAALATLDEGLALYPRDQQLLERRESLSQRRQSLIAALAGELQARLSQGDYADAASADQLIELAEDFRMLTPQTLPVPDSAIALFDRRLKSALDNSDVSSIDRLLTLGRLFFADHPNLVSRLSQAEHQEGAIRALAAYHSAVARGEAPQFPVAAADQLFAERIQQWQDGIRRARSGADLDRIYQALETHKLPASYPPVGPLRQQLADAYLLQADALLTQGATRQAQPLLRKATELMRNQG
ncbi:MAG: serine/threonine protein kinase [Marinobacter sp.]|nr:serine/threonine protein kinase [Marinobacter sp.]